MHGLPVHLSCAIRASSRTCILMMGTWRNTCSVRQDRLSDQERSDARSNLLMMYRAICQKIWWTACRTLTRHLSNTGLADYD